MSPVSLSLTLALVFVAVVQSVKYIDHSHVHGPKYLTSRDFANAKSINQHHNGAINDSAMYNIDLFEGDIVLPSHLLMKRMALSPRDPQARRFYEMMKNAIKDKRRQWPGGRVPYELSPSYTPDGRALIAAAMKTYETKTCVRFVPRQPGDVDYLAIQPLDGCHSLLGRFGGRQDLSLGDGCMVQGIAEHEMMHALGFDHEQSRPDRDQFVTIVKENILPNALDQFGLDTAAEFDTFGRPYDYGSVMHYGPKDFSKNGQPTIVPKQAGVTIGQRNGMSPSDVEEVNIYYGCGRSHPALQTEGPEPSETEAPEPSETEGPEPTETEGPEPTETEAPEPSETEAPEPSETEGPEPTETEGPEPTETEGPEPTETEGPEPTETEGPETTETEGPETTETECPEPSGESTPEPSPEPEEKGLCAICKQMEEHDNCELDVLGWCNIHCQRCVV